MDSALLPVRMNTTSPSDFTDPYPKRGPFRPAADPPPPYAFPIEVQFQDGTISSAVWTGSLWWARGEAEVVGWRLVKDWGMAY